MNRRGFLGFIVPTAAGLVIAPELLLPKRSFFLPPPDGWPNPYAQAVTEWVSRSGPSILLWTWPNALKPSFLMSDWATEDFEVRALIFDEFGTRS
jgi:hypothetical protein